MDIISFILNLYVLLNTQLYLAFCLMVIIFVIPEISRGLIFFYKIQFTHVSTINSWMLCLHLEKILWWVEGFTKHSNLLNFGVEIVEEWSQLADLNSKSSTCAVIFLNLLIFSLTLFADFDFICVDSISVWTSGYSKIGQSTWRWASWTRYLFISTLCWRKNEAWFKNFSVSIGSPAGMLKNVIVQI